MLPRSESLNLDVTDWSDVFEAAQSYNPGVVPLPLRMGRPRANKVGDVPPHDKGNIELLKVISLFVCYSSIHSFSSEMIKYY